ncbi:hypothetical protein HID58_034213 [Brassica napus]|uniref:tRNA pseudouridine synthase n=1 Tax=Brassica napus TaxID=3708 RepID=A0ABQ8C1D7_BRANA|nr:hypothetical protein HID58_034213 [Brassica napus]
MKEELEAENAKLLSQVSSCQCQQMEVKHDVLDSGNLVRRSRRGRKRADKSIPIHLISKRYVALKIMYFGKRFYGFSAEAQMEPSIESEIFKALERTRLLVGDIKESNYSRCGRTDKGVSSTGQVIALFLRSRLKTPSIDSEAHANEKINARPEYDYVRVLNRALPDDIRVLGWSPVPVDFHARFSCSAREYKYFFWRQNLNLSAMDIAGKKFIGEHDFRNFCKMDVANVHCYTRRVTFFDVSPCQNSHEGDQLCTFTMRGSAFLWHQVRAMVAVLFMIGQGVESVDVIDTLLDTKKTPKKPQYLLASEIPLVLRTCEFENVNFICSSGALESLRSHFKKESLTYQLESVIFQEALRNCLPIGNASNGMARVYMETLIQRCVTFSHIKELHSHLLTAGHLQSSFLRSRLLDRCAVSPFGDLSFAVRIFRRTPKPLTNDWNAIIRGYAASSQPSLAFSWYRSMLSSSLCRVDALTCSFTLKACARALCSSATAQLHAQINRRGLFADALLCTTLLDAYSKNGDLISAHKLFDEMPVRDVASWNALIAGLASGNRAHEALELYKRMESEGVRRNEVTVVAALGACSHLGAIQEGENIHGYVKVLNLDQNVFVSNATIDMYTKCGFVDKAFQVFDQFTSKKSIVTWNTMIMGFAVHGEARKALEIFQKLEHNSIKPDDVSYLAALTACRHAGLVEYGTSIFNSMACNGVEPNMKHYGCVVDLLGRAGKLREAHDIICSMSMTMVPDPILWQSLLGASEIHKDVEMAEIASKKLIELGVNNDGDFVLLSNIYAAQGRWKDVGRVRDDMETKQVKKIPGLSYIEAQGTIHKFYNSDKSHQQWRKIYEKIDEIRFKIREDGYVAQTGLVLHDIGEEEKENALCYHSEKLAVAYGLMWVEGAGEETPVRVIKNLRICGDCHVVFKHISKIYKREIIVRDRVRFHRFKDGYCSCKDYW